MYINCCFIVRQSSITNSKLLFKSLELHSTISYTEVVYPRTTNLNFGIVFLKGEKEKFLKGANNYMPTLGLIFGWSDIGNNLGRTEDEANFSFGISMNYNFGKYNLAKRIGENAVSKELTSVDCYLCYFQIRTLSTIDFLDLVSLISSRYIPVGTLLILIPNSFFEVIINLPFGSYRFVS